MDNYYKPLARSSAGGLAALNSALVGPPNTAFTLMPLTLRMILNALSAGTPSDIVINNTVVTTVRLVGRFLNQVVTDDRATFDLDDGTGMMKGVIWFGADPALVAQFSEIGVGGYGTFVGRVTLKHHPAELSAYSCRRVVDFNAITLHFLTVIKTHVDLTSPPQVRSSIAPAVYDDGIGVGSSALVPTQQAEPIAMLPPTTSFLDFGPCSTLPATIGTPISRAVLDAVVRMSESSGTAGSHIDVISRELMTTSEAIRPFLLDLASIGEVYTTTDDDHYKEI